MSTPTIAPDTAEGLLAEARHMATRSDVVGGAALRAAALLGRSALEEAIWSFFPPLKQVNGRAMLLTFSTAMRVTGPRAAMAWGRLTTASHHHAYELPPTGQELTEVLNDVHDVIDAIRDRQAQMAAKRAAVPRATGR